MAKADKYTCPDCSSNSTRSVELESSNSETTFLNIASRSLSSSSVVANVMEPTAFLIVSYQQYFIKTVEEIFMQCRFSSNAFGDHNNGPVMGGNRDKELTPEGAAEYYWGLFVERLQ